MLCLNRPKTHVWALALLLSPALLNCRPDPTPYRIEPAPPTPPADVAPLIALPRGQNFAAVSREGTGPKGALIARYSTHQKGLMTAYTYEPGGQLLGIYEPSSLGYDYYQLATYQDGLVQQVVRGRGPYGAPTAAGVQLTGLTRYRYNAQRQVVLSLNYERSGQDSDQGRLVQYTQYEYDQAGQLVKCRQYFDLSGLVVRGELAFTWTGGNLVGKEHPYASSSVGRAYRETLLYNQQPDPTPDWGFGTRLSSVNRSTQTTTTYCTGQDCSAGPVEIRQQMWQTDYDAQGRVARAGTYPADKSFLNGYTYQYAD